MEWLNMMESQSVRLWLAQSIVVFFLVGGIFLLAVGVGLIVNSAGARLGGVEVPRHEDTEQTIAELKARIAKTIAFINSVPQAAIDASADRDITLKLGKQDYTFKGMQYLLNFAQPNFYFHVTTAYDILRHNGVELIKKDYIGKF